MKYVRRVIRVPVPKGGKVTPRRPAPELEIVPTNVPQRKWFAAAAGALALQGLAAIGVDVGELGSSVADFLGLGGDPDSIEAGTRTAIGALAAHYLWPEYLNLPAAGRALVDRLLGGRR